MVMILIDTSSRSQKFLEARNSDTASIEVARQL